VSDGAPRVPVVVLNNGVVMPQLGLGVARVPDRDATAAVSAALEAGYRSIDTAKDYANEHGVGIALKESGIPRDELFVTTKVWNSDQGRTAALRAFDASLTRLGLDYVDLYLIHWPAPRQGLYTDTWLALERLYAERRVRAIGVSNFEPSHLRAVLERGSVTPAVNQIELHPRLQQEGLRALHRKYGIITEAWSPLGKGKLLSEPALKSVAERHGASPAQIILRWHLQVGNITIPKTVSPVRMRENLRAAAMGRLGDQDLAVIGGLDTNGRIGPHPDVFQ
jgi:2,5-diketo-D-gluconate reductase A